MRSMGKLIEVLDRDGVATAATVAAEYGISTDDAHRLLSDARRTGVVRRVDRGKYVAGDTRMVAIPERGDVPAEALSEARAKLKDAWDALFVATDGAQGGLREWADSLLAQLSRDIAILDVIVEASL